MTDPYGFYNTTGNNTSNFQPYSTPQSGAKRRGGGGNSRTTDFSTSGTSDWFVYESQKSDQSENVQQQFEPSDPYGGGYVNGAGGGYSTPQTQTFSYSSYSVTADNFYTPQAGTDIGGYNQPAQPNFFIPPSSAPITGQMQTMGGGFNTGFGGGGPGDAYDYENEPPLMEELGINFEHIRGKTVAVLNPFKDAAADVISDADLAGPLVFCLIFGFSLLLHGKMYFGNIYGTGMLGCLGMYALLNLMAEEGRSISVTNTASVLGYCLLPMALLSLLAAVLSFQGFIGYGFSLAAVFWSGFSSSKLFTQALDMHGQRILVNFKVKIFLFYILLGCISLHFALHGICFVGHILDDENAQTTYEG